MRPIPKKDKQKHRKTIISYKTSWLVRYISKLEVGKINNRPQASVKHLILCFTEENQSSLERERVNKGSSKEKTWTNPNKSVSNRPVPCPKTSNQIIH